TLPGNVSGGSAANAWRGYLIGNSIENAAQALQEKGPNGGGVGQWWSIVSPNSGVPAGSPIQATGSFTSATTGNDFTPAGSYSLALTYTRVATGIKIDWSMIQITDAAEVLNAATGRYQHNATAGVYSFSGSSIDTTPASSSWTYDELGFFLFGSSMTNSTIDLNNVNVAFVPEPASWALLVTGAVLLTIRGRSNRRKKASMAD
ncbi:MAG TPA: PEP-CTERM sorting domain-containing protein, partial [Pirellulales bacterium]